MDLVGVITAAAQDCGRDPPFRPELLKAKMRAGLTIAVDRRHDSLVLGAFGCGFFGNPPDIVAEVVEGLLKNEFAGALNSSCLLYWVQTV